MPSVPGLLSGAFGAGGLLSGAFDGGGLWPAGRCGRTPFRNRGPELPPRNHRREPLHSFSELLPEIIVPELQSGGLSHRCLRSCASFRSNLAEPAPEPEPGPLFVPGPLKSPQKRWFIRLSGYLCLMKITILGPAHPYRGGLASIYNRQNQMRRNSEPDATFRWSS